MSWKLGRASWWTSTASSSSRMSRQRDSSSAVHGSRAGSRNGLVGTSEERSTIVSMLRSTAAPASSDACETRSVGVGMLDRSLAVLGDLGRQRDDAADHDEGAQKLDDDAQRVLVD